MLRILVFAALVYAALGESNNNHPATLETQCVTTCASKGNTYSCYNYKDKLVPCIVLPNKTLLTQIDATLKSTWLLGDFFPSKSGKTYLNYRRPRGKRQTTIRHFNFTVLPDVVTLVRRYESERSFHTTYNAPNSRHAIYRATYVLDHGIILPLAMNATLRPGHVRINGTRERIPYSVETNVNRMNPIRNRRNGNNDENGHLLASVLGGPSEPWNFFPQSELHNRGQFSRWYYLEQEILKFLQVPGREVHWLGALSYDLSSSVNPRRPTAVALSVKQYQNNVRVGSLSWSNMYFTNNPDFSSKIEEDVVETDFYP